MKQLLADFLTDETKVHYFALTVALLVGGGIMGTVLYIKMKPLFSRQALDNPQSRMISAAASAALLMVINAIVALVHGYEFNGIFGFIEKFVMWTVMCLCVVYVLLSIRYIILWFRWTPVARICLALAFIPVGLLLAEAVFNLAGWPLFRALMNAWDKAVKYEGDPTQIEFFAPSQGMARAAALVVVANQIKQAVMLHRWPSRLIVLTVTVIIASFGPLISVVMGLIYALCGAGRVMESIGARHAMAYSFVDAQHPELSIEAKHALANAIEWEPRFDPRGR